MRVKVAEPITSSAPTAWRTARWKLRSCRNTGRQSETRARKRVSNTAGGSRLYWYQDPTQVHSSSIKNVQTSVVDKIYPGSPGPFLLEFCLDIVTIFCDIDD